MTLKIAVCIKTVPNPEQYDEIRLDPIKKTIVRDGIEQVINAVDLHAIELAMQIKEHLGAKVTLVSMGPEATQKQLREGLSYGCDEACLLSDRLFGGADSLATAYTLAKGLETIASFDLVLLGNASEDGTTAHVPSQLGELLEMPHLTDIVSFDIKADQTVTVKKEVNHSLAEYQIKLPAVFGVSKKINKVRHPNIKGIFSAKTKPLRVLSANDLKDLNHDLIGLAGSPTQPGQYRSVEFNRECCEIEGCSEEMATSILKVISTVIN
jgi:electron transfer flavoprotein beta subunit